MPANTVLIVGESGSGKSTAIESLNPAETFIINVSAKKLPFRGWKSKYTEISKDNPTGNMFTTDNADTIVKTLQSIAERRPEIKVVVIDDSQYVAANEYMRRINDKGFDKFVQITSGMFKIPNSCRELRDDLFVFFMSHAETVADSEGNQKNKAKTIGKMMDSTITYEGLFSIVLFTYKKNTKTGTEYGFVTNGDPSSTAKSPKGMFETEIPNNLQLVVDSIRAYED